MSKHVQTGLLAVAALAAIAVAGLRIAGAAGHKSTAIDKQERIYGTTPALAAATLGRLRTPSGFRRGPCTGRPDPEKICLARDTSITLDRSKMRRLLTAMGVDPYSVYHATWGGLVSAITCSPAHYLRKVRMSLQLCQGEVLAGDEHLLVFAHSLLAGGPASPRGTTRTLPGWSRPTELTVYVEGHFLHYRTREEPSISERRRQRSQG